MSLISITQIAGTSANTPEHFEDKYEKLSDNEINEQIKQYTGHIKGLRTNYQDGLSREEKEESIANIQKLVSELETVRKARVAYVLKEPPEQAADKAVGKSITTSKKK